MKRLEVSGAVRPLYGSLGAQRINSHRRFVTTYISHISYLQQSISPVLELTDP